jgi:uncharacterized protein (UPF0332 family)
MSFDWMQYLGLAQELFERASSSPYKEADLRSSISRAYYAAFHEARSRLYDKWGISLPTDATAHIEIRREFRLKNQQRIVVILNRMRIDRNKADYDDFMANLAFTAQENLRRAKQVIADLSSLSDNGT